MKFDLKYNQLPLFTLLCGGLGALLRLWLYGTGLDDEGLLVRGHAAGILVLILSALVIGSLIWFLRRFSSQDKYPRQFPRSLPGSVGAFAGAVGVLLTAMLELVRHESALGLLAGFLGIAALYGAEPFWLYPAGALWALTNLSRPAEATWYHRAKEEL